MILAGITHDLFTNTLEATWLAEVKDETGNVIEYKRAKCRNYSAEQKGEFIADCADLRAEAYAVIAGW